MSDANGNLTPDQTAAHGAIAGLKEEKGGLGMKRADAYQKYGGNKNAFNQACKLRNASLELCKQVRDGSLTLDDALRQAGLPPIKNGGEGGQTQTKAVKSEQAPEAAADGESDGNDGGEVLEGELVSGQGDAEGSPPAQTAPSTSVAVQGADGIIAQFDQVEKALAQADTDFDRLQVRKEAKALEAAAKIMERKDLQVKLSALILKAERAIAQANPPQARGGNRDRGKQNFTSEILTPVELTRIRQAQPEDDAVFNQALEDAAEKGIPITRQALKKAGDEADFLKSLHQENRALAQKVEAEKFTIAQAKQIEKIRDEYSDLAAEVVDGKCTIEQALDEINHNRKLKELRERNPDLAAEVDAGLGLDLALEREKTLVAASEKQEQQKALENLPAFKKQQEELKASKEATEAAENRANAAEREKAKLQQTLDDAKAQAPEAPTSEQASASPELPDSLEGAFKQADELTAAKNRIAELEGKLKAAQPDAPASVDDAELQAAKERIAELEKIERDLKEDVDRRLWGYLYLGDKLLQRTTGERRTIDQAEGWMANQGIGWIRRQIAELTKTVLPPAKS